MKQSALVTSGFIAGCCMAVLGVSSAWAAPAPIWQPLAAAPLAVHVGGQYEVSGSICPTGWTITDVRVHKGAPGSKNQDLVEVQDVASSAITQTAGGFTYLRTATPYPADSVPLEWVSVSCTDGVQQASGDSPAVYLYPADGGPFWSAYYQRAEQTLHVLVNSIDCAVGSPAALTLHSSKGATVTAVSTFRVPRLSHGAQVDAAFAVPIAPAAIAGGTITGVVTCDVAGRSATYELLDPVAAIAISGTGGIPGTGADSTSWLIAALAATGLGVVLTAAPRLARTGRSRPYEQVGVLYRVGPARVHAAGEGTREVAGDDRPTARDRRHGRDRGQRCDRRGAAAARGRAG